MDYQLNEHEIVNLSETGFVCNVNGIQMRSPTGIRLSLLVCFLKVHHHVKRLSAVSLGIHRLHTKTIVSRLLKSLIF